MKKENKLGAYILIGVGLYFLLREFEIEFITWHVLLIVIGLVMLIFSYQTKNNGEILPGAILLGIGIHLYGMANLSFWPNHWAVYLIIIGIAFILEYMKTKKNLLTALILLAIGLFFLFFDRVDAYFGWVNELVNLAFRFWPVLLILLGLLFLRNKK